MNYKESAVILKKIQSAKKILLSCHHHPDSDTVGAATVLAQVLTDMGKEVKIICPDNVPQFLMFINGAEKIEKHNFEEFNFSEWDLFIVCDTSTWSRLFVDTNFVKPKTDVVVIDNHTSNSGFGDINLLDFETSSVCEMLFLVLQDWGVTINKTQATSMLAGILGDTGSFQFEVHKNTFAIADKLTAIGANHTLCIENLFNNLPLLLIKFWGLAINKLQIDPAGFCYIALNEAEYAPYLHLYGTRETAANLFISKIEDSKFGFILTEESKNSVSVSFRSRSEVDTSKIALSLGGGGHPGASGAWIRGETFSQALENVLKLCREVA